MLSDVDQVYVASHPNLSNIQSVPFFISANILFSKSSSNLGLENFKRIILDVSITDKIKAAITEWLNQERLNS